MKHVNISLVRPAKGWALGAPFHCLQQNPAEKKGAKIRPMQGTRASKSTRGDYQNTERVWLFFIEGVMTSISILFFGVRSFWKKTHGRNIGRNMLRGAGQDLGSMVSGLVISPHFEVGLQNRSVILSPYRLIWTPKSNLRKPSEQVFGRLGK